MREKIGIEMSKEVYRTIFEREFAVLVDKDSNVVKATAEDFVNAIFKIGTPLEGANAIMVTDAGYDQISYLLGYMYSGYQNSGGTDDEETFLKDVVQKELPAGTSAITVLATLEANYISAMHDMIVEKLDRRKTHKADKSLQSHIDNWDADGETKKTESTLDDWDIDDGNDRVVH